ncbi:MAG: GAF domain-containing protein, partial [Candidatus Krumholzibacteriota bacterium]|nr:GAF domain-containing protein [Candidatus Krumholzibacteriota bacterium]
ADFLSEAIVSGVRSIAILGGGEEELNILSEFHRNPGYNIIAIYDRDPMAVGLEIAEIIGIPRFSDKSFIQPFSQADYIIVTDKRGLYTEEIALLKQYQKKIINPSEAINCLSMDSAEEVAEQRFPWPSHLEQALEYINRITDRERLLKWLLEISVRTVEATSGSIMLYSEKTAELYIGYASGLSKEVVKNTRQRIGEGIAGRVAEDRKPKLIEKTIDTSLYEQGRERELIQSAISAPLVYQNRLIGVLNVSTNRNEKRLSLQDVDIIELLASKISPILEQHLRINVQDIHEIEYKIRNYLEHLFQLDAGFHDKFSLLCKFIAEKLEADTVTIYTATDEGDWLILGGSDRHAPIQDQAPRIHCSKGSLARAFLDGEEVLMTETKDYSRTEVKKRQDSMSTIYLPLEHNNSLGVMVLEFSGLGAFERFLKLKDTLRFQIGFYVYSLLRDVRQYRKMKSLEELSTLTPYLMELNGISKCVNKLPEILSSLISASSGSFHYLYDKKSKSAYFNFPQSTEEKKTRIEFDREMLERVREGQEPKCLSFLTVDVDTYEKPPLYKSIIGYPLFRENKLFAVYIGYDKVPTTPLDSSTFGSHEIEILSKVRNILETILTQDDYPRKKRSPVNFNDLLKLNQKMLFDRIDEEIERAERYHHGFTVTLFRINGLTELFKANYRKSLVLINECSQKIRKQVRRTDFFSWIETDLFGILSLESYQRIAYLEGRMIGTINEVLKDSEIVDQDRFNVTSSYVLFPGASDSAVEMIKEAKTNL